MDTGIEKIDMADLQFVMGRHGSLCHEQNQYHYKGPSWPAQEPINPKG